LYVGKELRIKQKHITDCVPQHPTKGIMRIYPEQVKSSQIKSHQFGTYFQCLGAFYVHNE
jgi:hypothetical protein